MSNDTERYTLAEAAAELRRRECRSGHSFDVTEVRNAAEGARAIHLRCDRCSWSGTASMHGPDPSGQGA